MILDTLTYEQCVIQGVGPMVFPKRLEQGLDPANSAGMKAVCVHNMQQQVKILHTLGMAWEALTRAGITPVLMQGAGLAALYPDPAQRAYGDIDLFVGVEQYHPACAVMRETFPNALKFDEELDHYKHYNLIADGVSIEVHRVTVDLQHPCDHRRYAKMERFAALHACELEIGNCKLKIFEPTFNALLIMLHAWEHMMTQGACVRQLCDVSFVLHHYAGQIDAKRLQRYLKSLHLMDVWQLFMYILVQHLDLKQEEALFYDGANSIKLRAERLLNDLLEGRLVEPKHTDEAPRGRFARKFFTMRQRLANAKRIGQYSPAYGRHLIATTLLHGASRLFAKDRKWE